MFGREGKRGGENSMSFFFVGVGGGVRQRVAIEAQIAGRFQVNSIRTCTHRMQYPMKNPRWTVGKMSGAPPNRHSDCTYGSHNVI